MALFIIQFVRRAILCLVFYGSMSSALYWGQESSLTVSEETEDPELIFDYHWAIGGGLHTQGAIFNTYFVKKRDFWNGIIAEIAFGWIYDFKEISMIKVSPQYADPYVYGKKNFMFFNRFSFGGWRTLFEKYRIKGIEINLRYEGGLNLAYLKPVFVKVISNSDHHDTETVQYNENEHPDGAILGGASGFLGVPYTKVKVGGHTKIGLNFDWYKAKRKSNIGAFELGFVLDIYPQGIEIMAFQSPHYVFATAYFILVFGKKFM